MPVTKTAKRALRVSKTKTQQNKTLVARMEIATRIASAKKSKKALSEAFSLIDRAAKNKILHKNKAARLKSRLSKSA